MIGCFEPFKKLSRISSGRSDSRSTISIKSYGDEFLTDMAGDISLSDTAKLEAIIQLLGVLIKIGKYLPLMVATFASLNLALAYFDLLVWNHFAPGILNVILASGGFIFLAQLLRRRKIHRYDYVYHGRHTKQPPQLERKKHEVATAS